jgi:galactokinase
VSIREPRIRVSTPGRICLFGEHQDYLQLPVIPCAISLRVAIEGSHRSDQQVVIELPDIGSREVFSIVGLLEYTKERDYFKSVVNVLRRHRFTFSNGLDCIVRGNIPINAGTSSSSALAVTWVNFLAQMSDQRATLEPDRCAGFSYEAEVVEFKEPGGMMDQYSTALGGVIAMDFHPSTTIEVLESPLKTFVLGDSGEPKDTKRILALVKDRVLQISRALAARDPAFSLQTARVEQISGYAQELRKDEAELLEGTLRNRDITRAAKSLLKEVPLDHRKVGHLLTQHQAVLRDILGISTRKIDAMLDAALNAGAYGGKINGSGGGGCMFAYAPDNPSAVADAIESAGGRAYVVESCAGTRNECPEVPR